MCEAFDLAVLEQRAELRQRTTSVLRARLRRRSCRVLRQNHRLCNRRSRKIICVRASSRLSANLSTARPRTTSPGMIDLPSMTFFLSTMPTIKPARSYSPGDKSRHLGRFAAEQDAAVLAAGAGHAFDDRGRNVRLEFAGRKIIEKKQRPRTLHQNVVDAVVYKIGADSIVNSGLERQLQLSPDAIRRCTSIGSAICGKAAENIPPKLPISVSVRSLNVERAYSRIFATARFALSIETPASAYEIAFCVIVRNSKRNYNASKRKTH